MRREAGCIQLFGELEIGANVDVTMDDTKETTFEAEVVTKRDPTLGRGYSYGVKFTWSDKAAKDDYSFISSSWREVQKLKKKEKFSNGSGEKNIIQ